MGASSFRLLRLTGAVARTTGKRAVYAALPLYFLLGISASILFAGNGMDAKTITAPALASFPLRLGLLVGWALLTLPLARGIVVDRRLDLLRTLPVPRAWLLGIGAAALTLVQLGWIVLWVRGSGWLAAAEALAAVLAFQSCVILGAYQRWSEAAGLASVAAAWWLAPAAVSLVILVPVCALAHRAAWRRAPEASGTSRARGRVLDHSAPLSLAGALSVAALRDNASAAARALALILAAAFAAQLGERNAAWGFESLLRGAGAMWGAACVLGGITLARPMLRAEAELGWVLDVCAASSRLRAGASAGVLALTFGIAGLAVAASLWPALHGMGEQATLALHLALGGAAWATLAVAAVRAGTRGRGADSRRQLGWLLALYLSLMLLATWSPTLMVLALAGAAALGVRHAARLPTPSSAARGP